MAKSLYKTLQINEGANELEIKKAYRKLARQYHPDVNKESGAEDKFKEINSAYEILSDKEKKIQYDQMGDNMFGGQNFSDFSRSHGSHGSADLDDILRQMFSGGGGFGAGGNPFGGAGTYQAPNLDIQTNVTIPFVVSILGGSHSVSVNAQRFDIKIPAGVKSGEKMRVKGKGHAQGGRVGDMFLKITVASSPDYIREDDDIVKIFDLPLSIALFGNKIAIETLEKEIKLKVPENTKNSQRFRVKGMGVINRKTKIRGDLYLKANIILPYVKDLDEDLIKIMKEKLPKE